MTISGKPSRIPIRLKNYDYSGSGYYFITICVQNRMCLFGEIISRTMVLNDALSFARYYPNG